MLSTFHPALASAISTDMRSTTRDAADILALLELRFGSVERARRWFEEEPLPGFSEQTAQQLVQAGRAADVRQFVVAVDAGIHS
jgi:hypothetical protein